MAEDAEPSENTKRFEALMANARLFCLELGLPDDMMVTVYRAQSDWEFIIKIDALLEAAARAALKDVIKTKFGQDGALNGFIDALPMNGRTSLISMLKATNFPDHLVGLMEGVRRMRNGFAHDIRQVNDTLYAVLIRRNDKSALIRQLSAIGTYEEDELLGMYEKDPGFLRFGVFDQTIQALTLVYHVALKPKVLPATA